MKKNIPVRSLTALGGLTLLALAAGVAAQGFFGVPVMQTAGEWLSSGRVLTVLVTILLVLALAVLAAATVACVLPSRRVKPTDFVMQKGENGPIGIAIKAIEKKVMGCVAKHEEIASAEVAVREVREGVVILLNVDQVSGVNIPLSVGLLQKQIRQYVTDCTGVDVVEVRVMVENRTDAQVASAFGVEDTVCPAPVRPVEEFRQETPQPQENPVEQIEQIARSVQMSVPEEETEEPEEIPAPVQVLEIPAELPEIEPAEEAEDERPLHQRVFAAEEEPMVVPMPPVMAAELEEQPAEEAAEGAAAQEVSAEEVTTEEAAAGEAPADEIADAEDDEVSLEEDWTEPALQEAAEAVLAAPTMESAAEEDEEEILL